MADQLPADALRVIQDFEDAVAEKASTKNTLMEHRRQRAIDAYTETKKSLLNVFREIYGLEQLP